jgi:hypothetical protein
VMNLNCGEISCYQFVTQQLKGRDVNKDAR